MTAEVWRPIRNWPGYQISSRGHVRGIERTVIRSDGTKYRVRARVLKVGNDSRSGRPVVKLSKPPRGGGRPCFVDSLARQAFGAAS
jgi:hypothetical protein